MKKKPNLLLLGAQKSASTFLSLWLSGHPEVFIRSREDSSFENPEYDQFDEKKLYQEIDTKIYGIRRPDYFGNEIYQARLAEWLPDAKIVIVLRNPVDRAISAYYHYIRYGVIPSKHPKFLLEILKGNFDKSVKAYSNILEYGKYFERYTELLTHFPENQIHIIDQDELLRGKTFFNDLCEFLEISKKTPNRPLIKPQSSLYNYRRLKMSTLRLKLKMRTDEKKSKSYSVKRRDMNALESFIVTLLYRIENRLAFFYKNDVIDNDIRNALYEFYKFDIEKLEKLRVIQTKPWIKEFLKNK